MLVYYNFKHVVAIFIWVGSTIATVNTLFHANVASHVYVNAQYHHIYRVGVLVLSCTFYVACLLWSHPVHAFHLPRHVY